MKQFRGLPPILLVPVTLHHLRAFRANRRKVFVQLVPESGSRLAALYAETGSEMETLASSYSTRELEFIEKFLEANLRILKRLIATLSEDAAE